MNRQFSPQKYSFRCGFGLLGHAGRERVRFMYRCSREGVPLTAPIVFSEIERSIALVEAVMPKQKSEPPNRNSTRRQYEKQLRKLQTELCRLQDWVVRVGLRVIVIFEGRDAAGKGGTIKAITERVSPRVFRLVALPAPSDREKTQLYVQRYMQHLPGRRRSRHLRSQLVQPRRRGIRDEILHQRAICIIFGNLPQVRKPHRPLGNHPRQVLAGSWAKGAAAALRSPHRRSLAPMEAQPDGPRVVSRAGTTIPTRAT